jgi:hypothetical protein
MPGRVCRNLGGLRWAVIRPVAGWQTWPSVEPPLLGGVAKHYGVMIKICPPRAGHRKGVMVKVNHTAATLVAHPGPGAARRASPS